MTGWTRRPITYLIVAVLVLWLLAGVSIPAGFGRVPLDEPIQLLPPLLELFVEVPDVAKFAGWGVIATCIGTAMALKFLDRHHGERDWIPSE